MNLKNRHFLTLKDYSKEEIKYLLDLAHQLKADKKAGKIGQHLLGKNVCLIFEKTSTRTRCSFEVAALDEGGHATFLSNSQMGKKESIEDTAKVLGRMYDGIEFRGFKQETVEALAKYSGVPVWNGLTDVDHPTQTLADFLTIEEHLDKPLEDIKFVFTGDIRNNVCYGLMYGAVKMGMHFVCLGPKSLHIDPEVLAYCKEEAKKSGGTIEVTDNVDEAVKEADASRDTDWLIAMLPYKSLRLSSVKDRFGIYALVGKNENRDKGICKPRTSVRKQLSETKQAASPKKVAARSKQHEMEV